MSAINAQPPDPLAFALRTQLVSEAWRWADCNALACQAGPWRWLHDPGMSPTRRAAAITSLCGSVADRAGCVEQHGAAHEAHLREGIVALSAGALHWLRQLGNERAEVSEEVWRVCETLRTDGEALDFTPTFWAAQLAKHCGQVSRACFASHRDEEREELLRELVRIAALAQWWLQVLDLRKLRSKP